MEHVAIDLGGQQSQICIRDDKGHILAQGRIATHALGSYLSKRPPSRVIVETLAAC